MAAGIFLVTIAARPLINELKKRKKMEALLASLHETYLKMYAENICCITVPDSARKDEIVRLIISTEARKGAEDTNLQLLVKQVGFLVPLRGNFGSHNGD